MFFSSLAYHMRYVYNYTPSDSKPTHQRQNRSTHSVWCWCNRDSNKWFSGGGEWTFVADAQENVSVTSDKDFQWIRWIFFFFLLYLSFCCFSISHIECLRLNSLTKLRYDRSNSIWSGEQTSGNDNSSVCDEKSLNYAWQLLLFAIRFSVFLSYLCFQSKPFPYFHIIRRLLPFYHQTLPQLHVLAWRIRQYFKYKTI